MPICRHYIGGGVGCHRKESCQYDHITPIKSKKVCNYYVGNGVGCHHGDNCRYDHITPIKPSQGRVWFTNGQCRRFYTYGYCSYGESCKYSHQICPHGEYVSCPRGESCTYIHRNSSKEFQQKRPIHAKDFSSAKSSMATSVTKYASTNSTLKQPHDNFKDLLKDFVRARAEASDEIANVEETSRANEKFYTTLVKPSVNWQTKDQIVKYGLANPCEKRKYSRWSQNVSDDLEMRPVKRPKISIDVKQGESNIKNDKLNVKQSEFNVRNDKLNVKQNEFNVKDDKLHVKQSEFNVEDDKLHVKQSEFNVKNVKFHVNQSEFNVKNDKLNVKSEFSIKNDKLNVKQSELNVRNDKLNVKQSEFNVNDKLHVKQIEFNVNDKLNVKHSDLNVKNEKLNVKQSEFNVNDKLNVKQSEFNVNDKLTVKHSDLNVKNEKLNVKQSELNVKNDNLNVKQSEFDKNDKLIPSVNTNKSKNVLDADFHGFSEYESMDNDLTKAELNTQIINMENKYEENCSEFAQYYLVAEQKEKIDQSFLVIENNNTKFGSNITPKADNIENQRLNDVIAHPMEICQEDEDSLLTSATKSDEFSGIDFVKCSSCSSSHPAFVTGLMQDLKGNASWRCKDCTECAACKRDDCSLAMSSSPMMMCSICGDSYHVEEAVNENAFFCKVCGDFADYLLLEQSQLDISNHIIAT